jgi:acetyltransferase-like isoleucine patch superfamily enzyme
MNFLFRIIRYLNTLCETQASKWYLYYLKVLYTKRFKVSYSAKFGKDFSVFFDTTGSSISIGENVQLRDHCQLRSGRNGILKIGNNVFFNNSCSINCLSLIEIGNDCQFGEAVRMYDVNHEYRDVTKLISEQGYTDGKIIIGNNCWIGSNVTILKGVIIGDNVVIGANCLVHQSIPSNTVVMLQQELNYKPIK